MCINTLTPGAILQEADRGGGGDRGAEPCQVPAGAGQPGQQPGEGGPHGAGPRQEQDQGGLPRTLGITNTLIYISNRLMIFPLIFSNEKISDPFKTLRNPMDITKPDFSTFSTSITKYVLIIIIAYYHFIFNHYIITTLLNKLSLIHI